jgi:hypothetical protein
MPHEMQFRISNNGGNMPTLTIEAIRDNPWNLITHELPEHPTELLLHLAIEAADYCRNSEYVLMEAAREGRYDPPNWRPSDEYPDAHEAYEARAIEADWKFDELRCLRQKLFGE